VSELERRGLGLGHLLASPRAVRCAATAPVYDDEYASELRHRVEPAAATSWTPPPTSGRPRPADRDGRLHPVTARRRTHRECRHIDAARCNDFVSIIHILDVPEVDAGPHRTGQPPGRPPARAGFSEASMRIRHAATALVALGAASACALGGSVIHQSGTERSDQVSALHGHSWSVQASTDFGTTWTAPVSSYAGPFPVHVDTAPLRSRAAYEPITFRTAVGSRDDARATIDAGTLLEGDAALAEHLRIRAVESSQGTCAAPTFDSGSRNLLDGDLTTPKPVDASTAGYPATLPGGTRTTAGAPVTLCIEVSMAPDAPVTDGQVTLGWPIDVTRAGDEA